MDMHKRSQEDQEDQVKVQDQGPPLKMVKLEEDERSLLPPPSCEWIIPTTVAVAAAAE
jgi:hypothetical protein